MNTVSLILFIVAILLLIGFPIFFFYAVAQGIDNKYSDYDKRDRRVAESNIHSLSICMWDIIHNSSPEEKKLLEKKWAIIEDGTYLDGTEEYIKGSTEKTRAFLKRNNFDLYSEDFDPKYVAKCICEQEI